MTPRRLFLSSVQKEFAPERAALRNWLRGDPLMQRFADRLEAWNHGRLPESLTLAMLREPHGSVPGNPLLAEPLYLTQYIERMGTGTRDMIRRCEDAGLPGPEFAVRDGFVTTIRRSFGPRPESRPESLEMRVLGALRGQPCSKAELSTVLGHKTISGQLNKVIRLLLAEQHIAYTRPDRPRSRLQRYRLTEKGAAFADGLQARAASQD